MSISRLVGFEDVIVSQMKTPLENKVVIHLTATAVYTVVACPSGHDGRILIKAVSAVKCDHFVEGRIIHREKVMASIRKSVREVEEMVNVRVHTACVSFATPELLSGNYKGQVAVRDGVIDYVDMARALNLAKSNALSSTHYLMNYSQQFAWIDGSSEPITDAIGLSAEELVVSYHLMMMPTESLNDIYNLLKSCDIVPEFVIFDAVSAAEYSLITEERLGGVCLVDIGTYSTSVCVYRENILIFTACIAMGGHSVTMDIASELGISMGEADRLKREQVYLSEVPGREIFVDVTVNGNKSVVSKYRLFEVAKARYDAIFTEIDKRLAEQRISHAFLESGVVLTGGAAQVKGIIPYLRHYWRTPVHYSNQNPKIGIYTQDMKDDHLHYLRLVLQDKNVHTAFGTLIYSQSEQYSLNQKSDENYEPASGFLHKVGAFFDAFKKRF